MLSETYDFPSVFVRENPREKTTIPYTRCKENDEVGFYEYVCTWDIDYVKIKNNYFHRQPFCGKFTSITVSRLSFPNTNNNYCWVYIRFTEYSEFDQFALRRFDGAFGNLSLYPERTKSEKITPSPSID